MLNMDKFLNLFRRKRKRTEKEIYDSLFESEIEKITNDLIRSTVGSRGVLTIKFKNAIADYNAENMPIGENEVESVIEELLATAVSGRKLLTEHICASAEMGHLFERSFGKIDKACDLSYEVESRRRDRDEAWDDYSTKNQVYEYLRKQYYDKEVGENIESQPYQEYY